MRRLLPAQPAAFCPVAVQPAAAWPSRPVQLLGVVPPGGNSDIAARVLVEALSQHVTGRFVVDNRPGAGCALPAA